MGHSVLSQEALRMHARLLAHSLLSRLRASSYGSTNSPWLRARRGRRRRRRRRRRHGDASQADGDAKPVRVVVMTNVFAGAVSIDRRYDLKATPSLSVDCAARKDDDGDTGVTAKTVSTTMTTTITKTTTITSTITATTTTTINTATTATTVAAAVTAAAAATASSQAALAE
eukprot:2997730-Pyramimonas_sp.AAC.1